MKTKLRQVMAIISEAADTMNPTAFAEFLELVQYEIDKILDGDISDDYETDYNNQNEQ